MAAPVLARTTPRRPGRPRKPPPPRPRRRRGTGSISVTKSGRVFALDVRDADGHRASYEAVGCDVAARLADADRWLDERMAARARLAGLAPETVGEYLQRWLWQTHGASDLSSSRRIYRAHLAKASSIAGYPVADVTAELVDGITDAMVAEGRKPSYCRAVRSTLHRAFERLVPRVFAVNPVGEYPRPLVVARRRPNVLDEDDASAFEAEALATRWGLMWVLAIRYGVRGGELRALRRADLDRRRSEIHVRHGLRQGRRLSDTKNHQERTIRIHPRLMACLVAFMEGSPHSSPAWAFATTDGQALPQTVFRAEFLAIVAAVNARRYQAAIADGRAEWQARQTALPRLTPHGLRHTAATLMLRGSATRRAVSVAKVSEILGHHDPAFTYRMYSWALPSDDDVVDQAIGSLMAPLPISGGDSVEWQHIGSE